MADNSWIDDAFPAKSHKSLNMSVREILVKDPQYTPLFRDISRYILSLQPDTNTSNNKNNKNNDTNLPLAKKRRVELSVASENACAPSSSSSLSSSSLGDAALTVKEISFSVPQRKKFTLVVSESCISAVSAVSGEVEFGVRLDDIEYITCLPVPDKAARQYNFCLFPQGSEGIGDGNSDAIVFTIPDGPPKTASGNAMSSSSGLYDTSSYKSLLIGVLNQHLKGRKKIVVVVQEPSEAVFCSALAQSHRKGEKAFHVKAHRGSKEGYLFFLRTGIIWAFKKPLAYFSHTTISSVSYTSITKRTFNLSIHVSPDRGGAEIEFAMIDQEEYSDIDHYIKKNTLNDASMAEARKAKILGVNGKGGGGEDGEDGELEKAMVDLEDEEEEDYVPGQDEGEAGSGSDDSGGEDSEGGEDSDDMGSDEEGSVDLEDELGSELEDVKVEEPRPTKRSKRGGK